MVEMVYNWGRVGGVSNYSLIIVSFDYVWFMKMINCVNFIDKMNFIC